MASIVNTSRIAVVGLGQLGGSLAMRLKELDARSVYGVARRTESLEQALKNDLIEAGSTAAAEVLPVVDITFICMPVPATIEFVKANLSYFRPGSIVTDVGSVKKVLVDELRQMLHDHGTYFIGGHPMAGSEKFGLDFAHADLYTGKIVFLTPTPDDELEAINLVIEFWREIGSIPIELNAARHDQVVAYASDMPHLMSALIAKATLGHDEADAHGIACASGFRDITRVASGNVDMWREITMQNRVAILDALDDCQTELANLRQSIADGDEGQVAEFLETAKRCRDDWLEGSARGGQGNDNT